MSVTARLNFGMTAEETLTLDGASSPTVTYNQYDVRTTLTGSSTPPVSKVSVDEASFGTSGTIDLTALPGATGTQTFNGLKLRAMRVENRGTGRLEIQAGAMNGYSLNDAIIIVEGGGTAMHYFKDGLAAVSGSAKTLDYVLSAAGTVRLTLLAG